MGVVTGAVDDLIHGYEQLVHTIPTLSNRVNLMQMNTENLAIDLEVLSYFRCLTIYN